MQQTAFTDSFIKGMLGWIRWIASSIANLFQSGSGTSGGTSFLSWFAGNWIKILLVLIVTGVLVDWVVWIARWRPYCFWFRKRRILLDHEVEDIDDDDLMMHYDDMGRPRARRGRAVAYADDLDEFDDGESLDGFDEEYDDQDDGDYDDRYEEDPDEEGGDFDALYDDRDGRGAGAEPFPAPETEAAEEPDEDDDLPPARKSGRAPARKKFFARRRDSAADAEDPFSIEGDFFDDLGEDPMDDVVIHRRRRPDERDDQDTSVYRRPAFLPGDEPGAVRGADEDEGWHSGYTQRSVERGKRRKRDVGA